MAGFTPVRTEQIKVGIIGGTGLSELQGWTHKTEKDVDTIFGKPSSPLTIGIMQGVNCVYLARHGTKHTINPTNVNYRANILALKNEGCTHIFASTACGSLQEEIQPGDFVVPDQFIDRTQKRQQSFYDGTQEEFQGICHIPMHSPFCEETRKLLVDSLVELEYRHHTKGTVVTLEGPRFSSRAESNMFRLLGGSVVNMTTVPEVVLAAEAGMCYVAAALVTDYDCWHTENTSVSVEMVFESFRKNTEKLKSVLSVLIKKIAGGKWDSVLAKKKKVPTATLR